MEESTSREKVLKKVRDALISKTDAPFPKTDFEKPVFKEMGEDIDINFAQEFTKAGGKFVYCISENEVVDNLRILVADNHWERIFAVDPKVVEFLQKAHISFMSGQEEFEGIQVGITQCEYLIARLGSIMVSTQQFSGRRLHTYPDAHIVIAFTSQLVPDLKDALMKIRRKYELKLPSMISVITGPSRTADIEKTLVMGAHGPRELFVFLVEDRI